MGNALHYAQIDMIARAMRLLGKKVYFPMGLDRNGLPIEIAAEKEFKVNMHEIPREIFLDYCKQILDRLADKTLDIAKRLGLSCNSFKWENIYLTDSPKYRALTQKSFVELWEKGLIYEADKPTNWDIKLQTSISDAEIEYKQSMHELYEIEFQVKETQEIHAFATTRPELLPAIQLIIFNPDDERYQHLNGKTAKIPIFNKETKIVANQNAQKEFGTGLVQICSFGDTTDIRILRELGIQAEYAISPDGTMTDLAGPYQGLTIAEARKRIVQDLHKIGKIRKISMVEYRQPISERSGAPIEFIGMREFYLKQIKFTEILKRYAEQTSFFPKKNRQLWLDWLNGIKEDWCISRRRFYGTEVPIWYCSKCHEPHLPKDGAYHKPWQEPAPFEKCRKCNSTEFYGDTRTLDTWMDSSISALYIVLYPFNKENKKFLEFSINRGYLADLRPQGKDIVRTWLHFSFLRIHQLLEIPAFKHTWISGHIVSEKGEKMSKRKKNAVDPKEYLQKYGADALRLFVAFEALNGSDIRFSEKRVISASKFLRKIFNLANYTRKFDIPQDYVLLPSDHWILHELNSLIEKTRKNYQELEFQPVMRSLKSFTIEIFASHYIELSKARAYNNQGLFSDLETKGARWTLWKVLETLLIILSPVAPFITDYLFRVLRNQSVFAQKFPRNIETDSRYAKMGSRLLEFNSMIWQMKKTMKLPLNSPISDVTIPGDLKPFERDLLAMHKIEFCV